jgi:hypothetical protein
VFFLSPLHSDCSLSRSVVNRESIPTPPRRACRRESGPWARSVGGRRLTPSVGLRLSIHDCHAPDSHFRGRDSRFGSHFFRGRESRGPLDFASPCQTSLGLDSHSESRARPRSVRGSNWIGLFLIACACQRPRPSGHPCCWPRV